MSQSYRYDAIGNILEKAGVTYAYSDPSHPSAVTSTSDGKIYTYDLNGNMLNGAGRAQSWDADNRLAATTIQGGNSATYGYDSTGTRVKKTTSAGVMLYPFGSYEIGSDGVATKFLQIGIEKVAAKKSSGETLYYHNDHLGGVNLITDSQGVKVQLVEYDPWGQPSREEGSADPTHRFTGEELDPETGLLYYGGRHYDPALARFISPDPFIPRPWDPQSLNRYTYVRNNPVNRIDPTGYEDGDESGNVAPGYDGDNEGPNHSPAPSDADAPAESTGIMAAASWGTAISLRGAVTGALAGALEGALGGAMIGGYHAGLHGAISGAALGASFGALGGAISGAFGGQGGFLGGLAGAVGGAVSGIHGGVPGAVGGAVGGAIGGSLGGDGDIGSGAAVGGLAGAISGAISGAIEGGAKGAAEGGIVGAVAGAIGGLFGSALNAVASPDASGPGGRR